MRLTSLRALASRQAPNRNASDDLALVSCSATLACTVARRVGLGECVHERFEALLHYCQVLFLAYRSGHIASDGNWEFTKGDDHLGQRYFAANISLEQRECGIERSRGFR